jgi:hypothetical protein
MIYIFHIVDTGFVKLGFTQGNPWTRVATGFWSNIHPKACCHKLGWENLELLCCFDGGTEAEAAIKQAMPPHFGEFWSEKQITELLCLCYQVCNKKILPSPAKPERPPEVERATEKLPCCGGLEFFCDSCGMGFKRAHHLRQRHERCRGLKVECSGCVKKILQRNLKRHQSKCESYRAQAAAAMSLQSA